MTGLLRPYGEKSMVRISHRSTIEFAEFNSVKQCKTFGKWSYLGVLPTVAYRRLVWLNAQAFRHSMDTPANLKTQNF